MTFERERKKVGTGDRLTFPDLAMCRMDETDVYDTFHCIYFPSVTKLVNDLCPGTLGVRRCVTVVMFELFLVAMPTVPGCVAFSYVRLKNISVVWDECRRMMSENIWHK